MMFLSNTLKEKLKRDYLEGPTESQGRACFRYDPPPKDPRILLNFSLPSSDFPPNKNISSSLSLSSQRLKAMDKKEWEKSFTVNKLHQKWKAKASLNFDRNFKKFPDDAMPMKSVESIKFIKDFRDPDVLDLKQRRWNISTKIDEKNKPELKKSIFEIKSGFKDFKITPIKPQSIEIGVDSRNYAEIDGKVWDVSNFFDKKQNDLINKENNNLAKENSKNYWKDNEINRREEKQLPISENRQRLEIPRYFKRYRTPYQRTVDLYNNMNKVKSMTINERDEAEKRIKYNDPSCEKSPEKLNSLIMKDLFNLHRAKYNELIGKVSKKELKERSLEKIKFKWNDKDLVNKINVIDKFTRSPNYLMMKRSQSNNCLSHSMDIQGKSSLFPLVVRGTEIKREEEKIKDEIEEKFKEELKKKKLLIRMGKLNKSKSQILGSVYPLTSEEYESKKKRQSHRINDYSNRDDDDLDYKLMYDGFPNNEKKCSDILIELSKKYNCDAHFLEAYKRIAQKENEKIVEKIYKNDIDNKNIIINYYHPGTFREFIFKEKEIKYYLDDNLEQKERILYKDVGNFYWSCCLNSDKDSRGCVKKVTKIK